MTGFSRRPLALLLACLFSSGQLAQAAPLVTSLGSLPPAPEAILPPPTLVPLVPAAEYRDPQVQAPLALRKSKRMAVTPPPKSDVPLPSFLIADQVEGQTDESTVAQGNAELRKADTLLFADKLTYRPLDDEIEAEGNVRLLQGTDEIRGPRLKLKLTDQIGAFEQAEYKFSREIIPKEDKNSPNAGLAVPLLAPPPRRISTGYGTAERINFEGENQFRIENGTYSTCKPGEVDWYATGKEITLDYDRNVGEASHGAVYFKDVPFMYAPYLSFPLNDQRKSGFLAPSFASSTRTGMDFSIPYYWNIAPNYDATIVPRVMAKRGVQLGGEFRYQDYLYYGQTQVEYLPDDREYGDDRYAYAIDHYQNFGAGLWSRLNWNGVSDDNYFTDLSSRVVETSKRQLPKQFVLGLNQPWWYASMEVLRYQTLQPEDSEPITQPYFLEPRLTFNGRLPELAGLDLNIFGQYTSFTHPDLVNGKRLVAYPQLSMPYVQPGYYITPKIGVYGTQYQLTQNAAGTPDSISYSMPTFSLDAGMTFERDINFSGKDWTQTLEPRLFYLNIPYRDQNQIPVFDTALADFNFAQIFSENRYSGYDRISDANQLTAALTTRLIDPNTGAEKFRAMIGQRYYFKTPRVGLPGEVLQEDKFSDFLAAFSGQVAPKTYLDVAWEYDFNNSTNERLTVTSRYQPDYGKTLAASYRYNRGAVDQIDLAAQWNLSGPWNAVGRYNFSFDQRQLVEAIAGLEYNAGCWAGRFVAQRLESVGGSPNTNLFFQLELNDFGQVGSNPIQMLRRSVPGYSKVNELPSGNMLTNE